MSQTNPVNVQDLRWDDVRVFLIAQRAGTLGTAARKLGVDVSTMSRRLTALEEALGARLFDRTRQGLVPTRAAEVVLVAAEAMEAAASRLARDVSGLETAAEGVVRVSVPPGIADTFIAPALPRLRARYPRLTIELDTAIRAVDVARHEADLALRSLRPAGAELVVTKLLTAKWVPMTSAKLVARLGKLRRWEDASWIVWDNDLASMAPAKWLARVAPTADVALRTSHFGSQIAAAAAGLGIALIPEPYERLAGLARVRTAPTLAASCEQLPAEDMWLVGHRALRDLPRVAAVWTFLAELFRR